MFGWVWNLLYGISKSIYQLIDGLLSCANMLCGIEPIRYEGAEMDFLTFLLRNKNVTYGFVSAALIGVILVVIFAVIAIIRTISSEKIEMTPAQIFVKVGKTLLTFLFIPVCIAILIYFTNVFMQQLYRSTLGGSPDGMGRFLAGAFGNSARKSGVSETFYLSKDFDYTSTGNVKGYLNLDDYDYFFSWIGGIAILISLATSLLMFVDRAISLVILFIFAPISLSTSVLDDGQRFKLWRDQFIVKFLTGYGCIIALNIYTLIIAAITSSNLVFFDNVVLNNLMKIAIILGGAVSMQRIMALVGNLISQGAGSNELRDNAIATSQMRGIGRRALGFAGKVLASPFKATRSAANFVGDASQYGTGQAIKSRLGFNTNRTYGGQSALQKQQRRDETKERENYRKTGTFDGKKEDNNRKVSNAISGPSNNAIKNNGSNRNRNNPPKNNPGNKMIEMSILNSNGKKKE